jgi:hypothetical protein
MRHVRLPELNKNRVVLEQQKALVFDGQWEYNAIFGADFLSKTGVEYSMGIIEWFDNKLPMRDPCQYKEYLAMAEILEV